MRTLTGILSAVGCLAALGSATAAEWGTLKGQFLYGGKAPASTAITPTKDVQVCGKFKLVDEALVVGKTGGIANIAIWLQAAKGKDVPIHPDAAKNAAKKVKLDNKGCRFEPHILPVWVGTQVVELANSDPVAHNSNVSAIKNDGFNPLIPPGGSVDYKFQVEETLPTTVSCNIHPWMSARIIAKATPYVAVTGEDGSFTIENVPAGTWTFRVWHEQPGYLRYKDWKLGQVEVTIKGGAVTDLGAMQVPADVLKPKS